MSVGISKRQHRVKQSRALDGIEKRIINGASLPKTKLKDLQTQSAHMREIMGIKAKKIVPIVTEVKPVKLKKKVKAEMEAEVAEE